MTTIRRIPDAVHNALRAQAKRHNRSAEAEVRDKTPAEPMRFE
ncbi:FitA-like ribbon-helix-helix domain-containing protein [Marinobacter sp. ELB17]|nr:hypothetical protein [Marinobacter sp. ELB17]EAZ99939.1 hypothetical protein MELB17_16298 [Marinobacter sp. ELB17]